MINTSEFYKMTGHGLCGRVKKTERVRVREVDEHGMATVMCGERIDLVPVRDLCQVVVEESGELVLKPIH